MQIGPACYSVGGSRQVSVLGSFCPWQNDLEQQAQQGSLDPQPDREIRSVVDGGYRLFTMESLSQTSWMEVCVYPAGSVLFPTGSAPPTEGQAAQGVKYTPAQLRVTWTEPPSRQVIRLLDIGAGIQFAVPPTNQVALDLLVPRSGFSALRPDGKRNVRGGFDPAEFRFATTVVAKATCVTSPGRNRVTFTQRIYLDSVTNVSLDSRLIRLPPGTRRVVVEAAPGSTSAPFIAGALTATLLQTFTPEPAPPVPVVGGPETSLEFTSPLRGEALVPNNQNLLQLDLALLGYQADVAVVAELDIG